MLELNRQSMCPEFWVHIKLTSDFSDGDQYTVKNQAEGTDAGIYYAVLTLKDAGTYAWKNSDAADAQAVFEIAKAAANTLTPGTVPSDKTYDGKAAAAATASTAFGKVQIRYIGINGTSYDSENPPAGAGQYKIIAWADGTANYPAAAETQIGTFTISKANVTVPSGIRKAYTGSEQISDFQADDHYTVKSQAKGTKAGKYQAVLTLKDPANYCWTGSSLADASVTFEITKAAPNAITSGTVPGDKTYDGAAVPVATASSVYGPVKIRYVGIGGTSYSSENPPAAAGQYKAVAWVEATDDYAGVEDTDLGTFTIAMADVATPSGVTRTYNGADQTSDIEDCAQYTVTAQASGRNAGEYTATVTLTDPDNCKWADGTAGAVYHPVMTILPAVVEEPVIADKVYSGIRQKAYFEKELFTEGESTILVSDGNTGWIGEQDEICSYPFEMKLDSNHVWKGTGTDTAEFIFRIIPDPMDDVERSQEDKARGETYTSGLATIKVYTERKNGAPSTYIQNMNLALAYSLLSPEEQAAYDNGENIAIEVRLEVRPKAKEEIEKNDADAITEQVGKLTNGSLGIYLDLTLWKDVSISNGPVNTNQLHDTDPSVLRVRVTVPEELRRENRTYYVARSHDNAGTILFTEKVADTCIDLDFETDKFSIYAILYTEPVEKETETGDERTCWWKADDHGWVKNATDGRWYVVRNDALVRGWYLDDEDGFWYYLDPATGAMQEGWQQIRGDWYYFTVRDEVPQESWFYNLKGDCRWHYYGDGSFHPYGSLYRNESTPDGYTVDDNGVCRGKKTGSPEKKTENGWYKKEETGDWYFIIDQKPHRGWHDDADDGHRYYLDPLTGIMAKGWTKIGGLWFYFTDDEDVRGQSWFPGADGKWEYRKDAAIAHPLGSMYRKETAPDGTAVNEAGNPVTSR